MPASPRHPLVMAQQALAVHELAPGRLRLGVGSGDRSFLEIRYGLAQAAPLRYLKEYLEVLRGALWEGSVDYRGEFFQVVDTLSRTAQVPLLMPALGLKAFRSREKLPMVFFPRCAHCPICSTGRCPLCAPGPRPGIVLLHLPSRACRSL